MSLRRFGVNGRGVAFVNFMDGRHKSEIGREVAAEKDLQCDAVDAVPGYPCHLFVANDAIDLLRQKVEQRSAVLSIEFMTVDILCKQKFLNERVHDLEEVIIFAWFKCAIVVLRYFATPGN